MHYTLLKMGYLIHYNYVTKVENGKQCNSPNMKKRNQPNFIYEYSDKEEKSLF